MLLIQFGNLYYDYLHYISFYRRTTNLTRVLLLLFPPHSPLISFVCKNKDEIRGMLVQHQSFVIGALFFCFYENNCLVLLLGASNKTPCQQRSSKQHLKIFDSDNNYWPIVKAYQTHKYQMQPLSKYLIFKLLYQDEPNFQKGYYYQNLPCLQSSKLLFLNVHNVHFLHLFLQNHKASLTGFLYSSKEGPLP